MKDDSRALAATVVGATLGGLAGYLLFSERGRSVRQQIEDALDEFARELRRFRGTLQKAAGAANEGRWWLDAALGDATRPDRTVH